MTRCAIIGAGPIGLLVAITFKSIDSSNQICILEKHLEYQRTHSVHLQSSLLQKLASIITFPEFKEFINSLLKKNSHSEHITISTLDWETNCKQIALAIGVEIMYLTLVASENQGQQYSDSSHRYSPSITWREFLQQFSNTSFIIGADGSHSMLRSILYGEEQKKKQTLQYIVEVKCTLTSTLNKLKVISHLYPLHKIVNFTSVESNSKEPDENGNYFFTLRLFVDEHTYQQCSNISFSHPLFLIKNGQPQSLPSDLHISQKVLYDINAWLNTHEHVGHSFSNLKEMKIVKTVLQSYRCEECFGILSNQNQFVYFFLIGDAFAGAPFFVSMNNGIKQVLLFHEHLKQFLTQSNTNAKELFTKYQKAVIESMDYEIQIASSKNLGIQVYHSSAQLNASVPWQVWKWSYAHVVQFTKTVHPLLQKYFSKEIEKEYLNHVTHYEVTNPISAPIVKGIQALKSYFSTNSDK